MKSLATTICIRLASDTEERRRQALLLASKLHLPLCTTKVCRTPYHLIITDQRLELHLNPQRTKCKVLPVYIDFLEGHRVHRQLSTTAIKDPLPRAIGVKPGRRPTVFDATAGMGMDGMRLAWLGCKVILVERSPIIYELLDDGLRRAANHPDLDQLIKEKVTLLSGDSTEILPAISSSPDTVLLDPMYPANKKGPRNKKEMRMLRDLVGDDGDQQRLFHCALNTARQRVVVKRPKNGDHLIPTPPPHHQILMKSGRFDVYLTAYL